jgi:hemerythrin-like domain-containing protein
MMRIVHRALRRDLGRARAALGSASPPSPRQQQAIARHLTWMMRFLRAHHRSEDEGLYPLARQRNPAAGELLDAMNADHEAVAPAIGEVESAAAAFNGDATGDRGGRLAAAVDRLVEVLVPHLQREEDEMMPVVSAAITDAEWRALEYEYNLKPKTFVELGREGHWLIDDTSPQERRKVVSLVPAIPRFILVHGFAGAYRRQAAACWARADHSEVEMRTGGEVTVHIQASPADVYELVADVTRIGEFSPECRHARWLGATRQAQPGARFRGRNVANKLWRWSRTCEVVTAKPGDEFSFRTIPTSIKRDSTVWRYRFEPVAGGTDVTESYDIVQLPPRPIIAIIRRLFPHHIDMRPHMQATLDAIRQATETAAAATTEHGHTASTDVA